MDINTNGLYTTGLCVHYSHLLRTILWSGMSAGTHFKVDILFGITVSDSFGLFPSCFVLFCVFITLF